MSLTGCGAEAYIHRAQDYFTALRIGTPQIVSTVSGDKYAYSQLSYEDQILYDQIYACIMDYGEEVPISTKDDEAIALVFSCINADYGDLFWIDGYEYRTYSHGDYVTGMLFTPEYTMEREDRDRIRDLIDDVSNKWLSELPADADDYTKTKFVFESLINRVDYEKGSPDNQNIISVFLNGRTVCQGYACASNYLFKKLNIPSLIVTGTANNESHAWNLVNVDGDYYYFDATWGNSSFRDGDIEGKMIDYSFLNATTEQILNTHTISMEIPLPECTELRDNYFNREGLFFSEWDADSVGAIIKESYERGDASLSLRFETDEAYLMAKEYLLVQRNFRDYCPGLYTLAYLDDEDMDVLTLKFK